MGIIRGGGIFTFLATTLGPMVVEGIINAAQGKNFFSGGNLTKQMKEELDPMELEFAKDLKKAVNAELKKRKLTGQGFGDIFLTPEFKKVIKENPPNLFRTRRSRKMFENIKDV
jgi:hypothetical protein